MLAAGDGERAGVQSPQERRQSLRALAELAGDPLPAGVQFETLSAPAADGAPLELRRYRSAQTPSPGPALLYLHGGGWVAGDLDTHEGVCGALALASRCDVFALHYRRPPEHAFPGPIEDALSALAWLQREAQSLGVAGDRIGLAGDSAGANLAAAAAQDPRAGPLALLLLICPILDLARAEGSRETFGQGYFLSRERLAADAADYLQGAALDDPRASPLLAAGSKTAALTLVHAAACDPFRDEAIDYAARLEAAGARVRLTVHPGMIHYFYALARALPYARQGLETIGSQVQTAFREA